MHAWILEFQPFSIWLWTSGRQRPCLIKFWTPIVEQKFVGRMNDLVNEWILGKNDIAE